MKRTLTRLVITGMALFGTIQAGAQSSGLSKLEETSSRLGRVSLREEIFGVRPQVGFMSFTNPSGDGSRLAIGATGEMNLLRSFNVRFENEANWWFGPSSGLIFSHIGPTDTGFFGIDTFALNDLGSNVFLLPLNIKAAYFALPNLRIGAHAGANVFYRSNARAIQLEDGLADEGGDLTALPNIGLDLEIPIGPDSAITLRPDYTFTPGRDVFMAAVGYSISLGNPNRG